MIEGEGEVDMLVEDVRAQVLSIAGTAPVAEAIAAADDLADRAQALRELLRSSGSTQALDAVNALAAAADLLREVAAGFDAAATSCQAWAAGI
jgi:hypothetical protein